MYFFEDHALDRLRGDKVHIMRYGVCLQDFFVQFGSTAYSILPECPGLSGTESA